MKCDIIKIVFPGLSRGHLSAKNLTAVLVRNIEISVIKIFLLWKRFTRKWKCVVYLF